MSLLKIKRAICPPKWSRKADILEHDHQPGALCAFNSLHYLYMQYRTPMQIYTELTVKC